MSSNATYIVRAIKTPTELSAVWDSLIAPLRPTNVDLKEFKILDADGELRGDATPAEAEALQRNGVARYHAWDGWMPSRERLIKQLEKDGEVRLCVIIGSVK